MANLFERVFVRISKANCSRERVCDIIESYLRPLRFKLFVQIRKSESQWQGDNA